MASEQRSEDVVRLYFEMFPHAPDLAEEIMWDDVVCHFSPGPEMEEVRGRDDYKALIARVHESFPDMRTEVQDIAGSSPLVAARYFLSGTQTGVFMGRPPSGSSFKQMGINFFRLTDEKISEFWVSYNHLGMMQQLHVLPMDVEMWRQSHETE